MNQFLTDCKNKVREFGIESYETLELNSVADDYCEALDSKDTKKLELDFAILALRFWKQMINYYQSVQTVAGIEYDDLPSKFMERLNYACRYRAWQNPDKHTTAQACINQSIKTEVKRAFQFANFDKHKANHNNLRLDSVIVDASGKSSDNEKTLGDTISSDYGISGDTVKAGYTSRPGDKVTRLIQTLLDKNQYVEAIITDITAFEDSAKQTKETVTTKLEDGTEVKSTDHFIEFWRFKVVQCLKEYNLEYEARFKQKYRVDDTLFEAATGKIRTSSSKKLYDYISKTFSRLRADSALIDHIRE